MTYIFGGIDIPVFEILFIISIVLIVGLAIMIFGIFNILKELRLLKGLLKEEESDIAKFDADIAKLEKIEGKKSNEKLKKYIKASLDKRYPWSQIKKVLTSRGWDKNLLDQLYKQVKK